MVYFRGTKHENRICPRRHALDFPWVSSVHSVFNQTDGKMGLAHLEFSSAFVEAVSIVDDAVSWRSEAESK